MISALAFAALCARAAEPDGRHIDFIKDIQPILAANCISCHGPKKQKGGMRFDVKAIALRGGDKRAIVPGSSAQSHMITLITSADADAVMPPDGDRLPAEKIATLRAWIDQGALWPDGLEPDDYKARRNHWSFRTLTKPAAPAVAKRDWPKSELDAFILAKLEGAGLAPSPEADRISLIRRLSFDLLGLPPNPLEVEAFVADKSPDAYDKLVERLLSSPRYGERWARHWLDVVRFAESDGFETNQARANAWPYRDYVIRSLNEDKPYNQFVTEQLAGDALGIEEATGFIVGGAVDRVKSPDIQLTLQQRSDELHDMVSTAGSTFLGLTVGCARCHDHKFDPISQIDYYAMQAIFAGVEHGERPMKSTDDAQRKAALREISQKLEQLELKMQDFEPLAFAGRLLQIDDGDAKTVALEKPINQEKHAAGVKRGQTEDGGDASRLPNLGRNYSYWKSCANRDVFAWKPDVSGRFRVWLSWGCGWNTHAPDARYILDRDGDPATREDQLEIAKVDQRKFSDGSGDMPGQPLWSGFFNAGVHEMNAKSAILLRGGAGEEYVTADLLMLQEVIAPANAAIGVPLSPPVRVPVNRARNSDRFAPIEARYLRFTILQTTQLEPCIDELEVLSAEDKPRNVALRSAGTKATASSSLPGYEIHKLEHIHDGIFGNSHSWISNERGKGWVQFEFPETVRIDHVVWSRDREEGGRYNDRTATQYLIEVATEPGKWTTVATSADRLPQGQRFDPEVAYSAAGRAPEAAALYKSLRDERRSLEKKQKEAASQALVYAGKFVKPPATHRLDRGDPMNKREVVAPGALAEFGAKMPLEVATPDQARRVALAKWITDAKNPLPARVIVNRIWQHHFGEGIVSTPSDFGINGARPIHPELLDWLASEFISGGWSMKSMHRLIVRSATYRQGNRPDPKGLAADAQCRLLWRYPPQRLEAEPLRDAILAVSGKLDLSMGGPGFDLFEPNGNYVKVYNSRKDFSAKEFRRMVYQSKPRMQLDDTFGSFDCPDAGQITPKRTRSTTPLQALNLLNSRFILQQAGFLAERLKSEAGGDASTQAARAFKLAFAREAAADELAASVKLINEHGLPAFCRALLNANEFIIY